jgi:hypothetical protein
MEIPFGPRNLRLELGGMYKAYGRKNQGYPDELVDVDYCVAAAVLQIINCHGGRWSNGIIDVGRIEGSTWDMYVVNCADGCIFQMQESWDGYLLMFCNYSEGWVRDVVSEATGLARTFGRR